MPTVGQVLPITFDPYDWAADEDSKPQTVLKLQIGQIVRVLKAEMSAEADVTDADTNYNTYYLTNNSETLTTATICTLANGPAATGTPITKVGADMGTPVVAYRDVGSLTAVSRLIFGSVKTGTGLAVARLRLHVWVEVLAWTDAG